DNVARLGLLVIALPWTVGCTGSFGGEKDRDDSDSGRMGDDDDDIPTPDELKLNRNPTHTLKCEDPSAVPQSLLLSLSARQYTNTIRDLIRPIELSETPILPVDTLRPGFAPNDAFASASADLIDGQNTSALAVGTLVAD